MGAIHQAGIHFDSPSILLRLLPHSTMHLLSRCHISNPKDSRPHLVWGRETSRVLVSNVARMATMPESVPKTSQPSLLNHRLTPG